MEEMEMMEMEEAGKVAALYDIHGNLPALEAALAAADAAGAETLVVGGDVVLGPMPRETLDRLRALGPRVRYVRGNCDRLVVDAFDGRLGTSLPAAIREPIEWTASQLGRAGRDFLAAFPETLAIGVAGVGEVLFCHATPRSDEEVFTALTPAERVRPMLDGVTQRTVVCGHTHMQFDRVVDGVRVINAGSVGLPFAAPGAYWLLLDSDARLMRTDYDVRRAAEMIRQTSYPQPDQYLNPLTEEEALRLFERPLAGVTGE
jgi:putative phosphoesterase